MNHTQLVAAVRQTSQAGMSLLQRFEGLMSLHRSCCSSGDGKGAEEYRNHLHATLDLILDNDATIEMLKREWKP